MSTNLVKWDDTNNRLTAYCSDDTGETELGPVKWDDTNNKLELNCDSTDYQVKWNDTDNELEAQSVGSGCCECLECCVCYSGSPPATVTVTISGVVDCGDGDCDFANGVFVLTKLIETDINCIYRWQSGAQNVQLIHRADLGTTTVNVINTGPPSVTCFSNNNSAECTLTANNIPNELTTCPGGAAQGRNGTASW